MLADGAHGVLRQDLERSRTARPAAGEPAQAFEQGRLGAHERRAAVGEGHACAGLSERDGGLRSRVAAARDEAAPAAEVGRIVEAIVDLVETLPGHVEAPEVAAAADGDEHPPRPQDGAVLQAHAQPGARALDALGAPVSDADARTCRLRAQLRDQRFLDVGMNLERSGRCHVVRIGEDRLAAREVHERRERLGGLQHDEVQPVALRFDRRRHSGDAAADDHQVVRPGDRGGAGQIGRDRPYGPRSGVERELEQRNAGEVARHVDAGDAGRAVRADLGQLLHRAGRPLRVQPVRVGLEQSGLQGIATARRDARRR